MNSIYGSVDSATFEDVEASFLESNGYFKQSNETIKHKRYLFLAWIVFLSLAVATILLLDIHSVL